jgi:hypothetical protein
MHRVLVGNLKKSDSLEELSVGGMVIIKSTLKEHNGKARSGFIWLSTGKSGRLF